MKTAPFINVFALLIASSAIIGCDPQPSDPLQLEEFRSSRAPVTTEKGTGGGGGWISNGLADPDISGVDPSYGLSTNDGLSAEGQMLGDPARRATTQYLVECALEEGQSITKTVDGEAMVFNGLVGLAPEWEDDACDQDCQEWVSACLLARTNASGENVTLWLKADHPAVGMDDHLLFPIYEGSFFGNIFADPDEQYLCQGNVAATTVAFLDGRTCSNDLGESCGFTKYSDCELAPRCTFSSLLAPTALNCAASGGTARHTISTYISPL